MEEHVGRWIGKAQEIDALLTDLQNEIDAARNPNRVALKSLGVTNLGWTPVIYNDDAFACWSNLYTRDPEHMEVLHHLAIMYHARAIDLEQSDDPASADEDWTKSMECWHILWQSDTFWKSIAASVCRDGKRTPIDELRQEFPFLILKIHFDIAMDKETSQTRINYHIRNIMKSPFPEEAKELVRKDVYERFSKQIPDAIWETHSPDPEDALKALKIIKNFLEKDPGCIMALSDALSIFLRLFRSRMTDLQAMESDNESARQAILQELRTLGQEWRPYLEIIHVQSHKVDDEVRGNLSMWCRVMGEVSCGLDEPEVGISYYRLGAASDLEDDREAVQCRRKIGETEALQARKTAQRRDPSAKDICNRLVGREDLTVLAHSYLANAFRLIEEFEIAEEVCRCGINKDEDYENYELMEEDEQAREILNNLMNEINVEQSFRQARELIYKHEFHEAFELLNKIIDCQPGNPLYYFYRAHCLYELTQPQSARDDIEKCNTYGGEEISGLDAVKDLENKIAEQLQEVRKVGAKALRLSKKAQGFFVSERYEEAAELQRIAIREALVEGKSKLLANLSAILANWAIADTNRAQSDEGLSVEQKDAIIKESSVRIEEACELDPSNDHALQNLGVIKEISRNFMANELRNKAIEAFKNDNFDRAINFQRKALSRCRSDLRKNFETDLALILHTKAVKMANEAQDAKLKSPLSSLNNIGSNWSKKPQAWQMLGKNLDRSLLRGFIDDPDSMLQDSYALMEEAKKLDPGNSRYSKDHQTIRNIMNQWAIP